LNSAFAQAYPGRGANIGTSATVQNDPKFTSPAATTWSGSGTTGTAGAGNGTYTLQNGSPCKAMMDVGVLPFDLAGNARSPTNDTTGAYA
jgi:hypothetical protein